MNLTATACLKSLEEIFLHQHIVLLQCLAELPLLANQRVELDQVSPQHLHVLPQLCQLLVLCLDLTWRGWRWCERCLKNEGNWFYDINRFM